jgi:hypothetical protein
MVSPMYKENILMLFTFKIFTTDLMGKIIPCEVVMKEVVILVVDTFCRR